MKTKEERADNFLLSQGLVRGACASQIDYGARCMYDGYIQGDADRKAIDDDHLREATQMVIDKACEWLKARNVLTDASLEGFKRVMEEEI